MRRTSDPLATRTLYAPTVSDHETSTSSFTIKTCNASQSQAEPGALYYNISCPVWGALNGSERCIRNWRSDLASTNSWKLPILDQNGRVWHQEGSNQVDGILQACRYLMELIQLPLFLAENRLSQQTELFNDAVFIFTDDATLPCYEFRDQSIQVANCPYTLVVNEVALHCILDIYIHVSASHSTSKPTSLGPGHARGNACATLPSLTF